MCLTTLSFCVDGGVPFGPVASPGCIVSTTHVLPRSPYPPVLRARVEEGLVEVPEDATKH